MIPARHALAWLVALPLTAAGIILARSILPMPGSHPAGPHSHEAGPVAGQSVLAFLCSLPFLLSTFVVLALIAAVRAFQSRRVLRSSAWPLAMLVPLGFLFNHHLEHLVGNPGAALGAPIGPELLLGFVLQLPFALLAYVIVTALLRVAERLVVALVARKRLTVRPTARRYPRLSLRRPRIALLATAAAPRAPPLPA
ncbi:MAG TPA: hypothetical protein VD769_07090 [Gaiellaceae bacterium]|nr:hypothetical protein [Gaiellaceae bacterium]